ncbi:MAG: hypothetical protein ABI345_06070 [Jatrophihabitans sp.]
MSRVRWWLAREFYLSDEYADVVTDRRLREPESSAVEVRQTTMVTPQV